MNARSSLAAAALLAGFGASGIALGGFTTGWFHSNPAPPLVDDAVQPDTTDIAVQDAAPPTGPASGSHVCTGCDARLVREREWVPRYAADDDGDRDANWRPKAAGEEDGWVVDEYASAQQKRHNPASGADDEDEDDGSDAPGAAAPSLTLSDAATVRLPPLTPLGI